MCGGGYAYCQIKKLNLLLLFYSHYLEHSSHSITNYVYNTLPQCTSTNAPNKRKLF